MGRITDSADVEPPESGPGGRRVLVVEDNPVTADVVQFYLERAGCEVRSASNGRQALELIEEQAFDLIVTDYTMPELNGRDLCLRFRQSRAYRETPIVMVTAKRSELDSPEMRQELGLVEIFPKPFSPMELVRTVRRCLEPSSPSEED